jgi:hypothetical protein
VIQRRHGTDHRLGRRRRHCRVRCGLRPIGLEGATPLMTTNLRLVSDGARADVICRCVAAPRRILKAGSLSFGGGTTDYTVRNISDTGATLGDPALHS